MLKVNFSLLFKEHIQNQKRFEIKTCDFKKIRQDKTAQKAIKI
jgi:hypothetical protein